MTTASASRWGTGCTDSGAEGDIALVFVRVFLFDLEDFAFGRNFNLVFFPVYMALNLVDELAVFFLYFGFGEDDSLDRCPGCLQGWSGHL